MANRHSRFQLQVEAGLVELIFKELIDDPDMENLSLESTSVRTYQKVTGAKNAKCVVVNQAIGQAYGTAKLCQYITAESGTYTIPPKENAKHKWACDYYACCERHLIEYFFNLLKNYRRIATRYDKLMHVFFVSGIHCFNLHFTEVAFKRTLVILGYVSTETMKYNLDGSDNQAQGYYNEIKVIRKRSIRLGAIFGVCMWFVERLLDWKFRGVPIHIGVEQLNSYIQAIILGFLYGLILFIYWRVRLKRMFNE